MRTLITLLVAALAVAACGGAEESSGDAEVTSLDGDWELIEGIPLVAGFPITLTIADPQVSGRAACNSYFGTVTIADDRIGFGETGQTEMACEPPVMEAESAYFHALGQVDSFVLAGARLTLLGPDVELVFAPVAPVPTSALVDTVWVLDTLIEGDAASSVGGEPATLLLESSGALTGSTGCRTLEGRWLENADVIAVPELLADGDCPDDLWKQDSLVVTVIGDEFRAEVIGNRLTLTSMGGDGLVYTAGS